MPRNRLASQVTDGSYELEQKPEMERRAMIRGLILLKCRG